MSNTKKKTSKGLLGFYIASAVITLVHLVFFFIFGFMAKGMGDPEIDGVGNVISYHFKGVGELFAFRYGDASDLGGYALSVLLYAFIICFVIFLIGAALVAIMRKRRLMWWAIAIVAIDLIGYMVLASGTEKYFQIINSEGVFAGNPGLVFVAFTLIILGIVHFICSMVSYFWSIVEAYKNPRTEDNGAEAPIEEPEPEAPVAEEKKEASAQKPIRKGKPFIVQNFY